MNETYNWYQQLTKPAWAPPAWLFGPVWTGLYTIIAITYTTVFYQVATGKLPKWIAIPFGLNLVFNLAFTPLQFGLRSNLLAAVDIILVLATLIWEIKAIWPYARWIGMINLPYLAWVTLATGLQLTVAGMNWGR